MYETLTAHISPLKSAAFGKWVMDYENDGSLEHPIHAPYVDYDNAVMDFLVSFGSFADEHGELNLYQYQEILKNHNIAWKTAAMEAANVAELDGQTVLALIMGVIRADRFCEGTLLRFLKNGFVITWLNRLQEIDAEA